MVDNRVTYNAEVELYSVVITVNPYKSNRLNKIAKYIPGCKQNEGWHTKLS